jgi:hypothetical protein
VPVDPGAEAAAVTAALRALAPEPTVVPIIRTERPFYGARVGDLRALAGGWRRGHPPATPAEVADLADRLWRAGIREEQLVACFLLAGELGGGLRVAVRSAEAPARLLEEADLVVDGPEGVRELLEHLLG